MTATPETGTAQLSRGAAWLAVGLAATAAGQFAFGAIAARAVGPEVYGQRGFIVSLAWFLSLASDLGLSTLILRDFRGQPSKSSYLGTVLTLKMGASLVALIAVIALTSAMRRDEFMLALAVVLGGQVLMQSVANVLRAVLRSAQRPRDEVIVRTAQSALLVAFGVIIATNGGDILAFAGAGLAAETLAVVAVLCIILGRVTRIDLKIDRPLMRRLAVQGAPITLGLMCVSVYFAGDSVIMGMLHQDEQLGWYGAAYAPVLGVSLLAGAMGGTFLPALASSRDDRSFSGTGGLYREITFLLAFPIAIAGLLCAEPAMRLVYGDAFLGGVPAMRVLSVTSAMMLVSSFVVTQLILHNRQSRYLVAAAAGAGLNMALNLTLIPAYSLNGAAIATLAAELTVILVAVRLSKGLEVALPIPPPLVVMAAGTMGFTMLALAPLSLTASMFAGGPVYVATYAALKMFRRERSAVTTTTEAELRTAA